MLAQLAMAAGVRWQDTKGDLQPLAYRGWHIGRWIPTFLLIDGPLGKLLRDTNSPIAQMLSEDARLKPQARLYPPLCSARDVFNCELFRMVRNGFAHWSFCWSGQGGEAMITIVDWKTGTEQERVHCWRRRPSIGLRLKSFTLSTRPFCAQSEWVSLEARLRIKQARNQRCIATAAPPARGEVARAKGMTESKAHPLTLYSH